MAWDISCPLTLANGTPIWDLFLIMAQFALILALLVVIGAKASSDPYLSIPTRLSSKYGSTSLLDSKVGADEGCSVVLEQKSLNFQSSSRFVGPHFEMEDKEQEGGLQKRLPMDLEELQYHGTTTLSFICREGIIVAVDSRASMGKYVGSRTTRKVFPISKHILATMAGGAADCAHYIRYVTRIAKLLEYRSGSTTPVKTIATILALNLREARGAKLSVGTMICGWDRHDEDGACPRLFYVDSEGTCVPGKSFCVGSGANHAYSVLDSKDLIELSVEEGSELALLAIRLATNRDGYSGGYINVFHIGEKGIKHVKRVRAKEVPIN